MFKNTTKYTVELMEKSTMFNVVRISVIMGIALFVIGLFAGFTWFFDEILMSAILIWVIFGICSFALPFVIVSGSKKTIQKNYNGPGINDQYCINNFVFDENYMYARTIRNEVELSRETLPYELIPKAVAHNDFIQIFVTAVTLHVVTREGMTEGSYDDLVSLIASKTQGKFTDKRKMTK